MVTHLIYTIGHSNRSAESFLQMLKSERIQILVDIRSHPHSRRSPQFSHEQLRQLLEDNQITYHLASRQLGGKRKPNNQSQHVALENDNLRAFADYMDGDEFKKAAIQLINLSSKSPTVIMCAERIPQNCHRSLISDYLTLHNLDVVHLVDAEDIQAHVLSSNVRRETQSLIYDRYLTVKKPVEN